MIMLKCDNCGDLYDYGTGSPESISFHYYKEEDGTPILLGGMDICPACYVAIKSALNGRKKVVTATEDDLK